MEERKTLSSEISYSQYLAVMQERRADEVKRNFAIGIQRLGTAKSPDQERPLKLRIKA